MRASLVIASLNEGDRLWRTVRSCLETTGDLECELVVVDDASTDDSIDRLHRRFPQIRVCSQPHRRGVAPTRRLGAEIARGEVLIFLDGHCKPEPGAIARLVEDVERLDGRAVVNPRLAVLDEHAWENALERDVGHGFRLDLETLDRIWIAAERMAVHESGLREAPALAGCCVAVGRDLYEKLGGFDAGMAMWGVEDLDFGLKAWLAGHPVLHDPVAIVGHRFRTRFDNFVVPAEHVVANELRFARKHFADAAWIDWAERCRTRHADVDWGAAWALFVAGRDSLECERALLDGRRVHDEFWYADRFDLWWPRWLAGRPADPGWEDVNHLTFEELLEQHARQPRHREELDDANLVGTNDDSELGSLTLFLKLVRVRWGTVYVERAAFRAEGPLETIACASWLTHRIEGEPLERIRSLDLGSYFETCGGDLARSLFRLSAPLVARSVQRSATVLHRLLDQV